MVDLLPLVLVLLGGRDAAEERVLVRGSGHGLTPVHDLQQHVGVARLPDRAPAREVLPGQLAAGALDQLGIPGQVLAVQLDGAAPWPDLTMGVVVPARERDVHGAVRDLAVVQVAGDLHALGHGGLLS
jgi:hypothetical protein